ncbi:MAG TPA: RDD family protein [Chryseosolibacter sp.]|nr:RDD family protein [Chryseosolibacter sp.]
MQTISVRTTQNVFIHHPVASLGDRILAYLVDSLILTAYVVILIIALVNIDVPGWVYFALILIPLALYHLLFEIFMNGQSPGKRAMNIQVVRMDGTEPGFADFFLRWLLGLIERGAVAVLIIAINGKGQRLGDIVAGTTVVKMIAQKEITAQEVFITPEQTYTPTFPQATQLNAQDIELIQRALEAARDFGNNEPVMLVTEKIKTLLGVQTALPPTQFLYTIVKDYNHLNAL